MIIHIHLHTDLTVTCTYREDHFTEESYCNIQQRLAREHFSKKGLVSENTFMQQYAYIHLYSYICTYDQYEHISNISTYVATYEYHTMENFQGILLLRLSLNNELNFENLLDCHCYIRRYTLQQDFEEILFEETVTSVKPMF